MNLFLKFLMSKSFVLVLAILWFVISFLISLFGYYYGFFWYAFSLHIQSYIMLYCFFVLLKNE